MSKELKMLIISLGLLIGLVTLLYLGGRYSCTDVKYQDLNGTHSERVCVLANE